MTLFYALCGVFAFAGSGALLGSALGLAGLLVLKFAAGDAVSIGVNTAWNTLINFTFSAIPVFILMGDILMESGVSGRIYSAMSPVFRRVPGGLLHTNIAVCTVFGAVSGSSLATAAAVGSVAYPEMARRGYDRGMVVGSLAGGGTLGLLIPPSITLLIYGALTGTSIGKLFAAGIFPGLMMAALFMFYILVRCRFAPDKAPRAERTVSRRDAFIGLIRLWPVLFLMVAVLGTIFLGVATATEAAALGLAASIVIGAVWGNLRLDGLWNALVRGVVTFASIAYITFGAVIFAQSISILGIPQQLLELVTKLQLSTPALLVVFGLVYLIMGCFFEGISIIIMTSPVVVPVLMAVNFDPVWLGVVMTMMIEVALITPPVGSNLFVITAITRGEVTIQQTAVASVPYWVLMFVGVAILAAFPDIVMYLPNKI